MIGHETFDHLIERPARKLDGDIGGAFEFKRTRFRDFDRSTHPIGQIRRLAQGFESVASIEQHAKTPVFARDGVQRTQTLEVLKFAIRSLSAAPKFAGSSN